METDTVQPTPENQLAWLKKIVEAYGGSLGVANPELLAWLRSQGAGDEAIAIVSRYVIATEAQIGPILFYPEEAWVDATIKGFVPGAMEDGLLIVGTCPNGDQVALDVREHVGQVGYIDHEGLHETPSVRDAFLPVADTLALLALGIVKGWVECDYHGELRRQQREAVAGEDADAAP